MKSRNFYGNQYVSHTNFLFRVKFYFWLAIYKIVRLVIKAVKLLSWGTAGASLVIIGAFIAQKYMPIEVEAQVIKEVQVETVPPILERIADCESGVRKSNGKAIKGSASHLDPKTGQVYTKANKNMTVDIGVMMINEYYWGKTARDMGYDLTVEKDNRAFGAWLFSVKGSEPWSASRSCWL